MESEIKRASDEVMLQNAGWEEKHGYWTHSKRLYKGGPYLFSFEQALQIEENEAEKAKV